MEKKGALQNESKQLILSVAEKLFADNGFDRTSILMIAHTADVSAVTINSNFSSKTALLKEIFSNRLGQLNKMLVHIPELQMSAPDKFMLFSNICSLITNSTSFLCLLQREITYWASSPVKNLIESSINNTLSVLAKLVDAAIDDNYVDRADRQLVYLSFFNLMPVMGMGPHITNIINQVLDSGGHSFSTHRLSDYLIKLLKKNKSDFQFHA